MVLVEVGDKDGADVVAVDREPVHRHERCRTAIDQDIDVASDQMKTGVESSAGTERIAAADELQLHETRSPETLVLNKWAHVGASDEFAAGLKTGL
jgi:hypothetical protein